jgi:hypothetical protein
MLAACQQNAGATAGEAATATSASGAEVAWPATLRLIGDGYPNSGDPCRRIGESAATVNFLDDSADLAGCRQADDAARLGGKIVGVVDGITLVSVPSRRLISAVNGENSDPKVAGTEYNATAQVKCAGYRKHLAGTCPAGVKRNTEGGLTVIDITWPAGDSRALYFDKSSKFVGANTNQADGSAAFQPKADRRGDTIVITIGPERYEFAEVFVTGD